MPLKFFMHGNRKERRSDDRSQDRDTLEDWLAARIDLLEAEKKFTQRSDERRRRRQELPWAGLKRIAVSRRMKEQRPSLGPLPRTFAASRSIISMLGPDWRCGLPHLLA